MQARITIEANPNTGIILANNYDKLVAIQGVNLNQVYHNLASESERADIEANLAKIGMVFRA